MQEIAEHTIVKPYLGYLDEEANRQFALFWEENKESISSDLFSNGGLKESSLFYTCSIVHMFLLKEEKSLKSSFRFCRH